MGQLSSKEPYAADDTRSHASSPSSSANVPPATLPTSATWSVLSSSSDGKGSRASTAPMYQITQAVWMADEASKSCLLCEAPFTMLWRRHHCRECGLLVCQNCSVHRATARGFATPQRVCTRCITVIQQREAEKSNGTLPASASGTFNTNPATLVSERHAQFRRDQHDGKMKHYQTLPASSGRKSPASQTVVVSQSQSYATMSRSSVHSDHSSYASPSTHSHSSTASSTLTGDESTKLTTPVPSDFPQISDHSSSSSISFSSVPSSLSTPISDSIHSISCFELFNRLGGFGSLLVIDVRSTEEYRKGHVPRSLSLPIAPEDFADASQELVQNKEQSSLLLGLFEKRLDNAMEQRAFRMRQRNHVVIVGNPNNHAHAPKTGEEMKRQTVVEEEETDAVNAMLTSTLSSKPAMASSYSPAAVFLAQLFVSDEKVSTIHLLEGGYEAFGNKYPFVCCSYSEQERTSNRHTHAKAFPWYPSEIVSDFIWLGSKVDALNRKHLHQLDIEFVLNCSMEVPNAWQDPALQTQETLSSALQSEQALLNLAYLTYERVEVYDEITVDIAEKFAQAFAFLDRVRAEKKKVLIHCQEGISRSATILIAYLMSRHRLTLVQAYNSVKNQRKQVFPNLGFWKKLSTLEINLEKERRQKNQQASSSSSEDEAVASSKVEVNLLLEADGTEFKGTLDQCIDMNLLIEEHKARYKSEAALEALSNA